MRWDALRLDDEAADGAPAPLVERGAVTRRFDTPEFAGMTFYEVAARSALNKVPASSRLPFGWTVNPYRGCSHACVYCFARGTHAYLDLDVGRGFDTEVVVKTNVAQVLRRELARPSWRREHVAMGTSTDPYQRAEGRYGLMPGVLDALVQARTPFSVLTKGTLVLRDLERLVDAAGQVDVSLALSVGLADERLWRLLEPGTPRPSARLDAVRRLTAAGLRTGVMVAPLVPEISDDEESVDAAVGAAARAGAAWVTGLVLHLKPGAREVFREWQRRERPDLDGLYERLYARSAYAPRAYQEQVGARVRAAAARHGVGAQPQVWRQPERPGMPVDDAQENDGWRSSVRGTDGLPPRQDAAQDGGGGWRASSPQAARDGVQLTMI